MIDMIQTAHDTDLMKIAALRPSDTIDARVLAGTVAESHTVPTGARFVAFSGTGDFYVRYGNTAAIPAADVTNGTASELNPGVRMIEGHATIGLIAPADCVVTMAFYS